jgi:taurine dioxygenase
MCGRSRERGAKNIHTGRRRLLATVEPTGDILGATIHGLDLSKPLARRDLGLILKTIGLYGVVRLPGQSLTPEAQEAFGTQFGPIHSSSKNHDAGREGISVLSNIVENGKNIGYADAGLIWHRDMTYETTPGFANILYGITIPRRDGKPLGPTQFVNTRAAGDDLPADVLARLEGTIGVHNPAIYNVTIRAAGSKRPAYDALPRQLALTRHPILLDHPFIGRPVLYCDINHVETIEGLPEDEAAALLELLIAQQNKPHYQWSFTWTEGDVLMWDNLTTMHRVVVDYRPDEIRLIKRCQVLGDGIFDPAFIGPMLAEAGVAA